MQHEEELTMSGMVLQSCNRQPGGRQQCANKDTLSSLRSQTKESMHSCNWLPRLKRWQSVKSNEEASSYQGWQSEGLVLGNDDMGNGAGEKLLCMMVQPSALNSLNICVYVHASMLCSRIHVMKHAYKLALLHVYKDQD
eukprot:scaffold98520_cov17-Tisochrysis_lutea.AAC.1